MKATGTKPTYREFRLFDWSALLLIALMTSVLLLAFNLFITPLVTRATNELQEQAAKSTLDSVFALVESRAREISEYRRVQFDLHKKRVQDVVRVAEWHFQARYEDAKKDFISDADARQAALNELRSLRIGTAGADDYAWAANLDSVLISHPDERFHEKDFSELRDSNGVLIVPPMVETAVRNGEGYHSYSWFRLEGGNQEPKLAFSLYFEPWQIVLGSGVYVGDIEATIEERKAEMLAELKGLLQGIKIEKTGYVYIFDQTGTLIVHPNREGTDAHDLKSPNLEESMYSELLQVAQTREGLNYLWDRPEDEDSFVYEKRSWARHFENEDFNWYICSSVYTEELTAHASVLTLRIIQISALVSVAVGLALAYHVRRLRSRLKELSALRSEFLTISSHDMGNQLATLRLTVRTILSRPDDPERVVAQLQIVDELARDVQRMIRGIATREILESGQLRLSLAPTDPAAIFESHVKLKLPYATRKGIELELELPRDLPTMTVDAKGIGDVLGNLIDNALKFCRRGNRVIVRTSTLPSEGLRCEVIDDGPGLAEEDIPKAFSKHARLGNRPTAGEKSSGLGLYICRLIIELHRGTIGVFNNADRGCTFWFEVATSEGKRHP